MSFRLSFRPLFGDLSSIQKEKNQHTRFQFGVSVPSSGTYLPFIMVTKSYKIYGKFPSPLRGLIFHSAEQDIQTFASRVSVPSSGTYLPFEVKEFNNSGIVVSVPSSGTYLPFERQAGNVMENRSFRPLFGDLSSIPGNIPIKIG